MPSQRDYYEVLGVSRTATADEIRRAFRTLARKYHPDVSKEPNAATRFAEVQEAYEALSDAEKRKSYDRFGHRGVGVGAGYGGGSGGGSPRGGFRTEGFDPGDLGGMFDELFGGRSPFTTGGAGTRRPGAGAHRPQPRPSRGADVSHEITVPFDTAAAGGEYSLRRASGGAASETISVRIPPGFTHGGKLRVRGKGQAGPLGGEAGDLILTVRIAPHPYFRREDLDLLVDVPITIAEAGLGTTVQAPLMSGSVQIKVPPGTSAGRKMRVPEKGLTGADGKTGDFYAVIQIVAPEDLSDRGRELLDELGSELKNPRDSSPWADL